MQSSSNGGDDQEDFDSSTSFFNPNTHFLTPQNTTFFNPQHADNLHQDHGFPQSNDLFWSRGLRFDQMSNYADFGNFTASSSSPSTTQMNPPTTEQGPSSSVPPPPAAVVKNPKKRTRASHRAPTTVLTTDTTNFRQMVQEFTGIPATPFAAASPYINSRSLDLFSAAAALRPGSSLDPLGPFYPLRASAHKVLSPFPSSSASLPSLLNPTMIDSVVSTANIVSTTTTTTAAATGLGGSSANNSNNYPLLPTDHPFNVHTHSNQFTDLSGFRSQETRSATAQARDNNDHQKQ